MHDSPDGWKELFNQRDWAGVKNWFWSWRLRHKTDDRPLKELLDALKAADLLP